MGYDIDTCRLFAYLKTCFESSYYFESISLPRHQDRYYTIGFDPCVVFSARGDTLTVTGDPDAVARITGERKAEVTYRVDNPYHFLQSQLSFDHACKPHQGGLIGYFCHEAVNYFEPELNLPEHARFQNFKLGLYYDGLLYDTTTGSLSYYTFAQDRYEEISRLVAESNHYAIPQELQSVSFRGHSSTKQEFIESVKHTKEKIRNGYSFQAEVGFKSCYDIRGDRFVIYNKLRGINPSPYMFYLKFGEQELLGASPEILVSSKERYVLTTPTAGTIARGGDAREDVRLARSLLEDPKEIAEHNMLVDLHRNDLARVCVPGSVRVSDLMYIIKFSHVQHIVSNVVGLLQSDKTAFDVLAALLPGGVVTGAPKIETIKIINDNESTPRGPYGGAVGRFSLSGDCDFCLPIRSIFCAGEECYAQTSAGIVYDSVPEKEYIELTNKLAAMKQALAELGA